MWRRGPGSESFPAFLFGLLSGDVRVALPGSGAVETGGNVMTKADLFAI